MSNTSVSQDAAPSPKRGKRGRKPEGELIETASGFSARYWTMIDGEKLRVTEDLHTRSRPAAKAKLRRLVAEGQAAIAAGGTTRTAIKQSAKRTETFSEAMTRVYVHRSKVGRDTSTDLPLLRRLAVPIIGSTSAAEVTTSDVNAVFDAIQADGLGLTSCVRAKSALRAVFKQLKREGTVTHDPTLDAAYPAYEKTVTKERVTLTDDELSAYLSWSRSGRYGGFAFERQVMACVSRLFGGLRIGDIAALDWQALDSEHGRFEHGYAPRQKTKQPQKLIVPEILRPFLREWWTRQGEPTSGLIFPARYGDTAGKQRSKFTIAGKLRRDLKAAFKADPSAPKPDSRRWRELFEETDFTLPVDFHSFRRAYCQGLADAGVSLQAAMALAGHVDAKVHARYLRASHKARELPLEAIPRIKAPNKGGDGPKPDGFSPATGTALAKKPVILQPTMLRGEWSLPRSDDGKHGETSALLAVGEGKKAPPMPFSEAGSVPPVAMLPATAHVGLLDVLRAAREAHARGEHARVGSLIEAALGELEPAQAPTSNPGISSKRPMPRSRRVSQRDQP